MSVAFPLPRSLRRTDYTALAAQTVFGATPWIAFEAEDIRVRARTPPSLAWVTLTTGFTVSISPTDGGFVTVTFGAGRAAGEEIRVEGKRTHARITDVTRNGSIRTAPLERELDKMSTVFQELIRDVEETETTTELALSLIDGVAGSAADALSAASSATSAAGAATAAAANASAAAAALVGKTVSAGGLAVGGGLVTSSPTITVVGASQAQAVAANDDTIVMTPLRAGQATKVRAELADFTPTWTSGRTKPIRDLLRDWCRLDQDTQFDKSGAVDMSVLIDIALTTYDTVILPAGSNVRAKNLIIPGNNKRIVGEGWTSILRLANAGNDTMLKATGRSRLRFENFTLDGNAANNTIGNAVDFITCTDVRFDGMRIVDWQGNGIICQVSSADVHVDDCRIENVGSHGVSLSAVNMAKVLGTTIIDARLAGINLGAVGNFTLAGNRITRDPLLGATGLGAGGIRTTNTSTDGTISGNVVSSYDRGIMLITGAQTTCVTGNMIRQPWYDGIYVEGTGPLPTLDISVLGNIIRDANHANTGSYDGIRSAGTVEFLYCDANVIRDARGAPQMQYGWRDTSTGVATTNKGRSAGYNSVGGAAIADFN